MYNLKETFDFPGRLDLTKTLDQVGSPKIKEHHLVKTTSKIKPAMVLFVAEKEHHDSHSKTWNFACSTLETVLEDLTTKQRPPDVILISSSLGNEFGKYLSYLKAYARAHSVPMVLYSPAFSILSRNIALKFGFDDYYFGDLSKRFLKKYGSIKN